MADNREGRSTTNGTTSRVRPARIFRTIVLCALAGTPAACGPSPGPVEEPRPTADAGTASEAATEPDQPPADDGAVHVDPYAEMVGYYGLPLPETEPGG